MSIAANTLNFQNFHWIWMVIALISFFASFPTFLILVLSRFSRNLAFILAYWLPLGVLQSIILQSFFSWGYQWGLMTAISGSICFWLSGFVWINTTILFNEPETRKELLDKFFTKYGYEIESLLQIHTRSNFVEKIPFIQLFVICTPVIFFFGGCLLGVCQLVLFLSKGLQVSLLLLVINGFTWLLGYIIYGLYTFSRYPKGYGEQILPGIELMIPSLLISTGIGSLIQGFFLGQIFNSIDFTL
jgi:hypothetical protein